MTAITNAPGAAFAALGAFVLDGLGAVGAAVLDAFGAVGMLVLVGLVVLDHLAVAAGGWHVVIWAALPAYVVSACTLMRRRWHDDPEWAAVRTLIRSYLLDRHRA